MDLLDQQPLFIGFKLESGLRRQIEAIAGPDRKYISADDSTFLRICRLGETLYVGKLIHERMTTDRVEDVKRNVLSILRRLFPEERLPKQLEIFAASGSITTVLGDGGQAQAAGSATGIRTPV